jgi:hypothetical protein
VAPTTPSVRARLTRRVRGRIGSMVVDVVVDVVISRDSFWFGSALALGRAQAVDLLRRLNISHLTTLMSRGFL